MFWRKVFHILVISVLLMAVFVSPSTAVESKAISKTSLTKYLATSYTVCASGCDFSSIQTAIDSVSAGDTLNLAGETFTESITIDKDLTIQGAGVENTIVQAATAPGIATSRVVTVTSGISVTIQGVTIRYGVSPTIGSFPPIPTNGGGIRNDQGILNLINTSVLTNTASGSGGGIYNNAGIVTVTNSIFSGNQAYDGRGGGFYNYDSNPSFSGVIFSENSTGIYPYGGGGGGGLYNEGGNPILQNITFSGNTTGYYGGGIYNNGGNPTLTDVTFTNNTADGHGGGMHNEGGSSELHNVSFINNTSDSGGGMSNYSGSNATLEDVLFIGNSALLGPQELGGGIDTYQSTLKLSNGIFLNNSAGYGGGIRIYDGSQEDEISNVSFSNNSATYNGGGIYIDSCGPDLINLSFSNNNADIGGGMFLQVGNTTQFNTILWENTATTSGSQIHLASGIFTISHSIVQDSGGSGSGWDSNLGTDGGGNIDENPLFANASNDDLHLQAGSPAIDSGTSIDCPATDLEGTPRPIGGACDMGAYEYVPLDLKMLVDNPTPKPGETITFKIQVVNYPSETITNGLISNTLPTNLNFLETITLDPPMSGTVGLAPPTLVTGLEIGSGKQITVTFPVSVSYGLSGGTIITNTAWITSNEVITPVAGSISLTITNAAPIAVDDIGTGFTTDEDTVFTTLSVLANDTDPNGDTLTLQSFDTTGTLGLVTSNGEGTFDYDSNGQFEYLEQGEQATDSFTYTISDSHGGTDTATVTITITGVQDDFYIYLPVVMRP